MLSLEIWPFQQSHTRISFALVPKASSCINCQAVFLTAFAAKEKNTQNGPREEKQFIPHVNKEESFQLQGRKLRRCATLFSPTQFCLHIKRRGEKDADTY